MNKDDFVKTTNNRIVYNTIKSEPEECSLSIRKRWNWSLLICGLSLILNIVIVMVYCPRQINDNGLDFDYLGIIVGILSLLVTVLLAWNIYTIIDVKHIKDDAYKYISKEMSLKERYCVTIAMCYADALYVDDYIMKKKPELAVDLLFKAIGDCQNLQYCESVINAAIARLYVVCCQYHANKLSIYNQKKKYLEILSHIDGDYIEPIKSAILNAKDIIDYPQNLY